MTPALRAWALLPPALVVLPLAGFAIGLPVPTPLIVFTLLVGLMLTGMPVSISLGLTVLTFLFVMTDVPITSVALKLFTGIERFEIMAIPFFILAGNFLTHGGVARPHDQLRLGLRRALARRARVGRRHGLRALRRGVGLVARHGRGDRRHHPAGDGEAGIPEALRRGRHHHLGRARES
jgi:hypothetical protein